MPCSRSAGGCLLLGGLLWGGLLQGVCSRVVCSRGGLLQEGACFWGGVCSRGACSEGVCVETPLTKADSYCCGRYASYWNAFLLIGRNLLDVTELLLSRKQHTNFNCKFYLN